ncbi:MAG: molecular chaperone HtpG [Anaerolineales bacterium]|jgi:molecular chaperone HtpG
MSEEKQAIAFKAETKQLLNILIHSLYTEREIFLRELVSNASDALTRIEFETLTNRDILDPEAELSIRIIQNKEENTITITDTGIGMTADELIENLGTIAQSGARSFVEAASDGSHTLEDVIGQFGVGFYSAFMVAEWIRVTSRSYKPDAEAATWYSDGSDSFTVEPDNNTERGTSVIVKLKEDAGEYLEEYRLREIIKKHSDFIAYPIYIGDGEEQVNRQTAIWRQQPREVGEKEYEDFYKQLTLDFEEPLTHAHMVVDAPVQMYALLYIPANPERNIFSLRKEDGVKLYSRKVMIQEYCKDLLPEYLGFVEGVVDSEDIPLNVSRESVQANKIMVNLKKLVTNKILDTLKLMSKEDSDSYSRFWEVYARYLKQGVAIEQDDPEKLYPLLRFHSTTHPAEWSSLEEYVQRMQPEQDDIYYIMGDDDKSVLYSPHLDIVKDHAYEVLLLTDPVDAFMLARLNQYGDYKLINVASADLDISKEDTDAGEDEDGSQAEETYRNLVDRFRKLLGERVSDVRTTDRLSNSPARLVDPEGAPNQELQRVYRLLDKEFEIPKKVLEINPQHPIIIGISELPEDDDLERLLIEQIFEDALLIEGLHPDPAGMITRIQELMRATLR